MPFNLLIPVRGRSASQSKNHGMLMALTNYFYHKIQIWKNEYDEMFILIDAVHFKPMRDILRKYNYAHMLDWRKLGANGLITAHYKDGAKTGTASLTLNEIPIIGDPDEDERNRMVSFTLNKNFNHAMPRGAEK